MLLSTGTGVLTAGTKCGALHASDVSGTPMVGLGQSVPHLVRVRARVGPCRTWTTAHGHSPGHVGLQPVSREGRAGRGAWRSVGAVRAAHELLCTCYRGDN
mgnify:CR=1 FL=1